jgi:hypothetical protein
VIGVAAFFNTKEEYTMKKSRVFGCPPELEQYRVAGNGAAREFAGDSQNGLLAVKDMDLMIVFAATEDGEQVSVTGRDRVPSHEDMVWVRRHFWPRDAWVVQPYPSEGADDKGIEFRLQLCCVTEESVPPKWFTGEHEVTATNMMPDS